jgi:hypothetical protein
MIVLQFGVGGTYALDQRFTGEGGVAISFPFPYVDPNAKWDIGLYGTEGTARGAILSGGPALTGGLGDVQGLSDNERQVQVAVGDFSAAFPLGNDSGSASHDIKLPKWFPMGQGSKALAALLKTFTKLNKAGDKGIGGGAAVTDTHTGTITFRDIISAIQKMNNGNGSGRSPLFGQTVKAQGSRICPKDSSGQRASSC